MLAERFTFTALPDFSTSEDLFSSDFSNTWKRDLTFKLESSSKPRSGLSEAVNYKRQDENRNKKITSRRDKNRSSKFVWIT